MGLSAGAPPDEYDDSAVRLFANLVKLTAPNETVDYLRAPYRDGGVGLVGRIAAAVELFRPRGGPAA